MREQSTELTNVHAIFRINGGWVSHFFLRNYLKDRGVFHLRLESAEGNQFLATVDLKTVRVADKVDEVTVGKVNKRRFTNQTQELSVKRLSSAWKTSAVAGPVVITSSKSPQQQATNSLLPDCRIGNLHVLVGNTSSGLMDWIGSDSGSDRTSIFGFCAQLLFWEKLFYNDSGGSDEEIIEVTLKMLFT